MLWSVDQLPASQAEKLEKMVPRLAATYGANGTWEDTVAAQMGFSPGVADALRGIWERTLANAGDQRGAINPELYGGSFSCTTRRNSGSGPSSRARTAVEAPAALDVVAELNDHSPDRLDIGGMRGLVVGHQEPARARIETTALGAGLPALTDQPLSEPVDQPGGSGDHQRPVRPTDGSSVEGELRRPSGRRPCSRRPQSAG